MVDGVEGGRDWSVFARNAWLMVGLVCWVWRWGRGGTVIWDSLCIVVMHKLCGVGGGGFGEVESSDFGEGVGG